MRTTAIGLIGVIGLAVLAGGALASDDLRGMDSRASARRTHRDAEWLRAASVRAASAPRTLRASSSSEVSDLLEAWLRKDRGARTVEPQPASAARATPQR